MFPPQLVAVRQLASQDEGGVVVNKGLQTGKNQESWRYVDGSKVTALGEHRGWHGP